MDKFGSNSKKIPPTIILTGFMGCGKSSVARGLAAHLRGVALDLDERIEAHIGSTIPQFFVTAGEAEFRRIETQVLRETLEDARNSSMANVIATGGGIVTREENREVLKAAGETGALVVYLKATPEVLAERIRRHPGSRPLIDGGRELDLPSTKKRVEELLALREPWYEESANFIVNSGTQSLYGIALQIAERLTSRIVEDHHGT